MGETTAPPPALCRMRPWGDLEPEPDANFYLRIRHPHLQDITISGPYHTLEATFPNIRSSLRQSSAAMNTFEAVTENGTKLNQFVRIVGPLDADPTKTIELEMFRVQDAELKAYLPGPVYNVISATTGPRGLRENPLGGVQVEDMDLEGTFKTVEEAERKAREVLQRLTGQYDGATTASNDDTGRNAFGYLGVVMVPTESGGRIEKAFVIVIYDTWEEEVH